MGKPIIDKEYKICPCCGHKKNYGPNRKRDEVIRQEYAKGETLENLSIKNSIGISRIKQIIGPDNLLLDDRYKKSWREVIEKNRMRNRQIYEMRLNGSRYKDIKDKFNISYERVRQIIKRIERKGIVGV